MKIELTEFELELLKKVAAGKFNVFGASDEEHDAIASIEPKVSALMKETDEYEQAAHIGPAVWFLQKYEEQQKAEKVD